MMPEEQSESRHRLRRLIGVRATQVGLMRIEDLAQAADLTREGLRQVRFGNANLRPKTKKGLEQALQWKAGSVDRILEGGDPVPADSPEEVSDPPNVYGRIRDLEDRVSVLERLLLQRYADQLPEE